MGIGVEHTKDKLQGDGVTTQFPFSFPVADKQQVKCIKVLESGEEIQILTSEYSVKIGEIGGVVSYPLVGEPLAEDEIIVIYRNTAIKQDYSPDNGNTFDALVIRKEIDRLTMIAQELQEQLNRAVKTTMSSNISPDSYLDEINTLLNNARIFYNESIKTCQETLLKAQKNADLCESDAQAVADALADIKKMAADFDSVVKKATTEFNNLKESNIDEFNKNCENLLAAYNQNATVRLKSYNDNHNDKLLIIGNKVEDSTVQANRAKEEADRAAENAASVDGSTLKKIGYEKVRAIPYADNVTLTLQDDDEIIVLSQRSSTITIDTSALTFKSPVFTVQLLFEAYNITTPMITFAGEAIKWINGYTPYFAAETNHLIVLRKFKNGKLLGSDGGSYFV